MKRKVKQSNVSQEPPAIEQEHTATPSIETKHGNSLANLTKGTQGIEQACAENKAAFIKVLSEYWPNVSKAAAEIGVARSTVFDWRNKDKALAHQWDEIEQAKLDRLETNVVEVGLSKGGAGYAFPVLKAYRRHIWGDQTRIDGQLTNVHIVSAVRAPVQEEDRARIMSTDN
jgi:hypothetical protein